MIGVLMVIGGREVGFSLDCGEPLGQGFDDQWVNAEFLCQVANGVALEASRRMRHASTIARMPAA